MMRRSAAAHAANEAMAAGFAAVRDGLNISQDFAPQVLAEANDAARSAERPSKDATDVEFVTVDPPSATDLDQALHIARRGSGFVVRYAIADVAMFVTPHGALDDAVWDRVQTVYLPDGKIPLHPKVLSEDAASLLPGVDRPAYVWTLGLDADGALESTSLERAMVRSRAKLDYEHVQRHVSEGTAGESLHLLKVVGELRAERERQRGGASLRIPDQEVHCSDGLCALRLRPPVPSEDWNAQISLLTGMAAADVMITAGVGVLRTLPDARTDDERDLRRQAQALGVTWRKSQPYGEFLRSLDVAVPEHLALMYASRMLFRGAAYTAFDGQVPELTTHGAVAAQYAHTTAPLRRLVDRYTLATCEAVLAGRDVPSWVRERLPQLDKTMRAGDRRANAAERKCLDIAEAATLASHVGKSVAGVVVGHRRSQPEVQLTELPIVIPVDGEAELGDEVAVTIKAVNVVEGTADATL